MDNKMIIEAIGYTGSALVLISFLMVSVVKLRIVNTIGSIIFTIYAFIIHSYPTAIMNLCLVMINIYYLVKMGNTSKETKVYDLVKVSIDDSMLKYIIEREKESILKCFPGLSMDFNDATLSYLICHDGTPAGIFIGKEASENNVDILLDYSLPEYRDFSIGKFLFSKLPDEGVRTLTYKGPDEYHKDYLSKYEFIKEDGVYKKTL
jgi:hypothetical protein